MQYLKPLLSLIEIFSAPLGRVLIALIFLISGLNKMSNYANTAGWMDAMGVPGELLPIVIALEFFGGLAIIAGWQTKIVSFLLAGFCLLSAVIFHNNLGDQNEMFHFMKNISLAGGFLFLTANGAGKFSLDKNKIGPTT
ncbi:MAG: DoxX family protein [Alphaproteobacteria bacterium]